MKKILLITGWGVGIEPLIPLQLGLENHGYSVRLINIFDALDTAQFQQALQLARQADVLVGWSLGGQLATLLALAVQQQDQQCKPLMTLASNPCFVQNEAWSHAMEAKTFAQFKAAYLLQPQATLKKFCYMNAAGSDSAKSDWVALQKLLQDQDQQLQERGLELLEQLNVVDILKNYAGPQCHLFAAQDFIVPCKIVEEFHKFPAKFMQVETLLQANHAFPYFQHEETLSKIQNFIDKSYS